MTTVFRTSTFAVLIVLLAACGAAAETGGGEIGVADVRAPVPAGPNAAVYMTLTNESDTADRLVGVSSDVTDAVELHETQMTDGSMQMQQLDGMDIPAGGETVLEPGGMHVMLIGVDGLAEGDTIDLTLSFDNAGDQDITAEIVPLGDEPDMDMSSESGEMDGMGMSSES